MTADAPQEAPKSAAELQAEKLIKRQRRNTRKAHAEGFLTGVCSQLGPGDLVMDCGANLCEITTILGATGTDVIPYEPDPHAFKKLHRRFADTANVELVNAAVGAS